MNPVRRMKTPHPFLKDEAFHCGDYDDISITFVFRFVFVFRR
jgi:hypothetical protein